MEVIVYSHVHMHLKNEIVLNEKSTLNILTALVCYILLHMLHITCLVFLVGFLADVVQGNAH